jgi:hypothetical protein
MGGLITFAFCAAIIFGVSYIFIGMGISLAKLFCKKRDDIILVGVLLGLGFISVAAALIYAGCSDVLRVVF